jgi:hypothetical protein
LVFLVFPVLIFTMPVVLALVGAPAPTLVPLIVLIVATSITIVPVFVVVIVVSFTMTTVAVLVFVAVSTCAPAGICLVGVLRPRLPFLPLRRLNSFFAPASSLGGGAEGGVGGVTRFPPFQELVDPCRRPADLGGNFPLACTAFLLRCAKHHGGITQGSLSGLDQCFTSNQQFASLGAHLGIGWVDARVESFTALIASVRLYIPVSAAGLGGEIDTILHGGHSFLG